MLTARAVASRASLLFGAVLVALVLVELSLRLSLGYLPLPLADALGTGYVDFGSGIYRFDRELNMDRMRPYYRREMFFNGYFWHHQTDWMGFRNPGDRYHVDIVLIGDSMIYGHGLEEPSTVSSHLERLLRRPVGNLGIQGGAMDNEYEILRHDAVKLKPSWVLVFFLNNDLTDLGRLSDDDLRRFIDLPLDDHLTRYFHFKHKRRAGPGNFDWRNLYIIRGYLFLAHRLGSIVKHRGTGGATPRHNPVEVGHLAAADAVPGWTDEPPFANNARMQLAMHFHLRAIAKADDFAYHRNMHFAYVFIPVPQPFDSLYESIIADYCRTHDIAFFSLRQSYDDAQRVGLQIFLPHDGHLSDAGAMVTAQALADHFPLREH